MSLDQSLVDFVASFRGAHPTIQEAAQEIADLSRCGADWGEGSQADWESRLAEAVRRGFLELVNDRLRSPAEEPQVVQMTLF